MFEDQTETNVAVGGELSLEWHDIKIEDVANRDQIR